MDRSSEVRTGLSERIGIVSIRRPQYDVDLAEPVWQSSLNLLRTAFLPYDLELLAMSDTVFDATSADKATKFLKEAQIAALVVQYTTFADAVPLTVFADGLSIPLVLWAVPEPTDSSHRLHFNSLTGVNQAANVLERSGRYFQYARGQDPAAIRSIVTVARAAAALRQMVQAEVVVVGNRPPGFITSDYDEAWLVQTLGLRVRKISLQEFFAAAQRIDSHQVEAALEALPGSFPAFHAWASLDRRQLEQSVRATLALEYLVSEESLASGLQYVNRLKSVAGLRSVAVECWPSFMTEFGGAACWAVSCLNAQGTAAACETDVNGAVTMQLLHLLSHQPPYLGDMVDYDEENIFLWHCGAGALNLSSQNAVLTPGVHPNRRVALTLEGSIRGGRVTVARLGRDRSGHRLLVATGQAVDTSARFAGTNLTIRTDLPAKNLAETLIRQGWEMHYAAVHAEVAGELKEVCRMKAIPMKYLGGGFDEAFH